MLRSVSTSTRTERKSRDVWPGNRGRLHFYRGKKRYISENPSEATDSMHCGRSTEALGLRCGTAVESHTPHHPLSVTFAFERAYKCHESLWSACNAEDQAR